MARVAPSAYQMAFLSVVGTFECLRSLLARAEGFLKSMVVGTMCTSGRLDGARGFAAAHRRANDPVVTRAN